MRGGPDRAAPSIGSRTGALVALVLAAELALAATVGASEPAIARPAVDPSWPVHQELVAQSADPAARVTAARQRLRNPCPPGHRVELVFGETSLLIDPEWVTSASIGRLNDLTGGICPEEGISGSDLGRVNTIQ